MVENEALYFSTAQEETQLSGASTQPPEPQRDGLRMGQQALNYAFQFLAAEKVFGEVI